MRRMYSKPQLLEAVEQEAEVNGLKAFENIVDKDGHKRFVDFDGTLNDNAPITGVYAKASLSGSHLLVVLAFSIADTETLTNGLRLVDFTLPEWVYNKIVPVWGGSNISRIDEKLYADNWTSQTMSAGLSKESSNRIRINNLGDTTLTADRKVRIAFDLLIDNE